MKVKHVVEIFFKTNVYEEFHGYPLFFFNTESFIAKKSEILNVKE